MSTEYSKGEMKMGKKYLKMIFRNYIISLGIRKMQISFGSSYYFNENDQDQESN